MLSINSFPRLAALVALVLTAACGENPTGPKTVERIVVDTVKVTHTDTVNTTSKPDTVKVTKTDTVTKHDTVKVTVHDTVKVTDTVKVSTGSSNTISRDSTVYTVTWSDKKGRPIAPFTLILYAREATLIGNGGDLKGKYSAPIQRNNGFINITFPVAHFEGKIGSDGRYTGAASVAGFTGGTFVGIPQS